MALPLGCLNERYLFLLDSRPRVLKALFNCVLVYSPKIRLSNLLNDKGLGSVHFSYLKGEFYYQDDLCELLKACIQDWFTKDYFPNLKNTRSNCLSITVLMLPRSEFQVMATELN